MTNLTLLVSLLLGTPRCISPKRTSGRLKDGGFTIWGKPAAKTYRKLSDLREKGCCK